MMMKKFAFALLFSASLLHAQDEVKIQTSDVQIGDVLEIGTPETRAYKHIDFPRANFIIKRGGLANYKALKGDRVVVTSVESNKDGSTKIKIKRKDGGRFFGSHTVVSADISNALATGELVMN
ncbi:MULTISPECIES: hypothetical protein [Zobellia]|uniref:hypothetical protein n=1 Tax=Zobellia TaxID=112040 RepID=UPI001FEB8959|nr:MULTISPECIES: hypothetical protein [Zobellia]MDO6819552.1 hypothetical protein [Zobellia sp. 1_MG-2023]